MMHSLWRPQPPLPKQRRSTQANFLLDEQKYLILRFNKLCSPRISLFISDLVMFKFVFFPLPDHTWLHYKSRSVENSFLCIVWHCLVVVIICYVQCCMCVWVCFLLISSTLLFFLLFRLFLLLTHFHSYTNQHKYRKQKLTRFASFSIPFSCNLPSDGTVVLARQQSEGQGTQTMPALNRIDGTCFSLSLSVCRTWNESMDLSIGLCSLHDLLRRESTIAVRTTSVSASASGKCCRGPSDRKNAWL